MLLLNYLIFGITILFHSIRKATARSRNGFYNTDAAYEAMLVPVRCFTCGSLVADKYAEYSNRVRGGEDPARVMDSMNVKRYCCRRMFISSIETIYQIIPYYEALRKRKFEIQSEIE